MTEDEARRLKLLWRQRDDVERLCVTNVNICQHMRGDRDLGLGGVCVRIDDQIHTAEQRN